MSLKVIVFETNNYHTEVFPAYQYYLPHLLDTPIDITYYANYYQVKQMAVNKLGVKPYFNKVFSFLISKLSLREFFVYRKVLRIVSSQKPCVVIFNSIDDAFSQKLFTKLNQLVPIKMGTVHNPLQFKFKRNEDKLFFVLCETIYSNHYNTIDGYFLPFLQPLKKISPSLPDSGSYLIGVQGQIDFERRDYDLLIAAAKKLKAQGAKNLKFNIIGTLNIEKLQKKVVEGGFQELFVFHKRLDDQRFFEEIAKCDYLMPLLGRDQKVYFTSKMTASYSHSAAYGIPMIIYNENASAWGLTSEQAMIYSDLNELCEMLLNIEHHECLKLRFGEFVQLKLESNIKFLSDLGRNRQLLR